MYLLAFGVDFGVDFFYTKLADELFFFSPAAPGLFLVALFE